LAKISMVTEFRSNRPRSGRHAFGQQPRCAIWDDYAIWDLTRTKTRPFLSIPQLRFKNVEALVGDVVFNGIKTRRLSAERIKPLSINK
jgi:hypothetical protein